MNKGVIVLPRGLEPADNQQIGCPLWLDGVKCSLRSLCFELMMSNNEGTAITIFNTVNVVASVGHFHSFDYSCDSKVLATAVESSTRLPVVVVIAFTMLRFRSGPLCRLL